MKGVLVQLEAVDRGDGKGDRRPEGSNDGNEGNDKVGRQNILPERRLQSAYGEEWWRYV